MLRRPSKVLEAAFFRPLPRSLLDATSLNSRLPRPPPARRPRQLCRLRNGARGQVEALHPGYPEQFSLDLRIRILCPSPLLIASSIQVSQPSSLYAMHQIVIAVCVDSRSAQGKPASSTCARRACARGGSAASMWFSARVPLPATAGGVSAGWTVQPGRDKRCPAAYFTKQL